MEILSRIMAMPIRFHVSVTDKTSLYSANLRRRDVFYKFCHARLANRIESQSDNSVVNIDELCDEEFRVSLRRYLDRQIKPRPLFQQRDFQFVKSHMSPLIQVSDMIAGTIGQHCFEKPTLFSPRYRDLLASKLTLEVWPRPTGETSRIEPYGVFDSVIFNSSVLGAQAYLDDDHEDDDQQITLIRKYIVQDLLLSLVENQERTITSTNLMIANGLSMSEHGFKTQVMAKIRDADVNLLGLSSGYKLAASEEDIIDYLNHTLTTINPWLNRVKKAMDRVSSASKGGFSPLDEQRFEIFHRYG